MGTKNNTIEVMKSMTMILVVVAHVSKMYTEDGAIAVNGENVILSNLTSFIYSFHMPVFFALSGFVYYICKRELGKYKDNIMFVKNKALRLLVPCLFFLFLNVIPVLYAVDLLTNDVLHQMSLLEDLRHLWFLPTLFAISVLFNLFEEYIYRDYKKTVLIALVLFFVSSFVPHVFQISNILKYFVFYYIGYLFAYKKKISTPPNITNVVVVMAIWTLTTFFILLFSNKQTYGLRSLMLIVSTLCGFYMLYCLSYLICKKGIDKSRCLVLFSKNSFGIYLFHPMFIYLMFYFLKPYNLNSWLLFVGITLIVLIISFYCTSLIRMCGLRMAIGEK